MKKLPRFDSARALVVGDAMLDRYWQGEARRISAEAPIPVVDISDVEDRPGGAANVALNIATLGAHATLVAGTGTDEAATSLENKLTTAGVDCYFHRDPEGRTTTKLRVISRKQQLVRADFEKLGAVDQEAILALVASVLPQAEMVLLSDYDKGVLAEPAPVIDAARDQGIPVLVDPKFKNFSAYAGASIIKPNRMELEHAVGGWASEAEMVEKCQKVIADLGLLAMLVTRGSEGMTLVEANHEEVHFPARTREVYDVTGAGDTVIAVLGAALASGETLSDAVGLANVAAGIVVSHSGTVAVSGPELRLEVAAERGFDRGIMSRDQIIVAVGEARARGEKVVFTNGCFDILHAGHVDYLSEAKREGDRLVVAVNGDESVGRLKGQGRPINSLHRRMAMLAGLQAVDWVVPFSEDTPEPLLEDLKPDVLVKGGDYGESQVVGAEIVRGYGGVVKVLSLVEDCSTSALVEKIRNL